MKMTTKIQFNPVTGDYLLTVKEEWLTHYSRKRVTPFYGKAEREMVINIKKNLPTFVDVKWEDREKFIEEYVEFFAEAAYYNDYPEYVELLDQKVTSEPAKWDTLDEAKLAIGINLDEDVELASPYSD